MATVRAQVSVPAVSSDTEDTVVNTWCFQVDDATVAGVTNAQAALDAFYTSLVGYFWNGQNWAGATIKWYDLGDPEPRVPFAEGLFVITGAASSTCLPQECCVCLSFQGTKISGVSQARRRGRVFLGPLASSTVTSSTGLLTSAFVSAVRTAAQTLLDASGLSDWTWEIYSRTSGTAILVNDGWVDNAVDIQRRRGIDATTRSTFS